MCTIAPSSSRVSTVTRENSISGLVRHPLDILLSVELHYFFRIFGFLIAVKLFSLSRYLCAAATP
jgi:hypothetical protein